MSEETKSFYAEGDYDKGDIGEIITLLMEEEGMKVEDVVKEGFIKNKRDIVNSMDGKGMHGAGILRKLCNAKGYTLIIRVEKT